MILIADSGSTKTDWILTDGAKVLGIKNTRGLNPVLQSHDEIEDTVNSLIDIFPEKTTRLDVFFYGAGCIGGSRTLMSMVLAKAFAKIAVQINASVDTDLLGAARAACGHAEGIACILGTGANSCLYDGRKIIANTPPLGYVLGDEGSGACLGKLFLNGIFKGWLSERLRDDFLTEYNLTYADVIERVYRQPMPNRFLATIVPFINKHKDDEALKKMIVNSFRDFINLNVRPYKRSDLPLNFVGGVAHSFSLLLKEAALAEGFTIGSIIKAPLENLLKYHSA